MWLKTREFILSQFWGPNSGYQQGVPPLGVLGDNGFLISQLLVWLVTLGLWMGPSVLGLCHPWLILPVSLAVLSSLREAPVIGFRVHPTLARPHLN